MDSREHLAIPYSEQDATIQIRPRFWGDYSCDKIVTSQLASVCRILQNVRQLCTNYVECVLNSVASPTSQFLIRHTCMMHVKHIHTQDSATQYSDQHARKHPPPTHEGISAHSNTHVCLYHIPLPDWTYTKQWPYNFNLQNATLLGCKPIPYSLSFCTTMNHACTHTQMHT